MAAADVIKLIQENDIKFVDLRFTDTRGKEQHVTVPSHVVDEDWFEHGHAFDGSSIAGWKGIQASDMLLAPDPSTAKIDPFFDEPTVFITCDVIEPSDGKGYDRDPRSIAKRAEAYLKSTGIGDTAFFGPEPEFFIFDASLGMPTCPAAPSRSTPKKLPGPPQGHRWRQHRPPSDGQGRLLPGSAGRQPPRHPRCHGVILEEMGIPVEVFHHEVATAGQNEIGTKFNTLVERADWTQTLKYVVHNVAHQYGKTATFMPKPIVGDNGSGMHVHQSIWKDGKNMFAGNGYAGLSETALYYIGGIIKHAKALNAITNPGTNSYKRLVPHYEAPVKLAYSARNRSASIRIPHVSSDKGRRIEARFPDPAGQPVPVLLRTDDGWSGRHPEQDSPRRSG
jgi:glutamine synthetase